MPLYEYLCLDCGETTEVIQKFSDPPLTKCANCGGGLERLLSAPAIQFKGSGWYVTDYARNNGEGNPSQSSPDSKEKKAASTSDSKAGPVAEKGGSTK